MIRVNVHQNADSFSYDKPALAGWFDFDSIQGSWSDADHNGNGSGGTGRGQALILTAGGKWVLEHWTRWQNEKNRYEFIPGVEARDWLLENHEDTAVTEHFSEIEDEEDRLPGRPSIGGAVYVRLGALLDDVMDYATAQGTTQAEATRLLIAAGLASMR